MLLAKMVKVDDDRVKALTPEAFRLVLEARGWPWHEVASAFVLRQPGAAMRCVRLPIMHHIAALGEIAIAHHNGSTFDAFVEVERVQALLSAVEAAERGEWEHHRSACITPSGLAVVHGSIVERLWSGRLAFDPERAAREARAQLPRLVRIICGVEDPAP